MLSGGRSAISERVVIRVKPLDKPWDPPKISLNLIAEGVDYLTKLGYDRGYGARPFNRAIQQKLENPLAPRLFRILGQVVAGDTIYIDAEPT